MKKFQSFVVCAVLSLTATACSTREESFVEDAVDRNAAIANDDGLPFIGISCCINDIATDAQGDVWVGGSFDTAGKVTGGMAQYLNTVGAPLMSRFTGTVRRTLADGNGGYFAAGSITNFGTASTKNVVHINRDGTLDRGFDPAVTSGTVTEIALGTVNGSQVLYVVQDGTLKKLNALKGDLVQASVVLAAFGERVTPDDVKVKVVSRGILVAGQFLTNQGERSLTLFIGNDGKVATLTADAPIEDVGVYRSPTGADIIVIGGGFASTELWTSAGRVVRNAPTLVKVTWDNAGWVIGDLGTFSGGEITAVAVGANGPVTNVYLAGSQLHSLVGGQDTYAEVWEVKVNNLTGAVSASPVSRVAGGVARINVLLPQLSGNVDTLVVGGSFTSVNGTSSKNIAYVVKYADGWRRVDVTTQFRQTDGEVTTAVNGQLGTVVGGLFEVTGYPVGSLLQLDRDGVISARSTVTNAPVGTVYTIAASGDSVYVGGSFNTLAGDLGDIGVVGGLVKYSDTGALVRVGRATGHYDWSPVVRDIQVSGQKVYVGGSFSSVGNVPRRNFATIDSTFLQPLRGRNWENTSTPEGEVYAIAVSPDGTKVALSGNFDGFAGVMTPRAAVIDENIGNLSPYRNSAQNRAGYLGAVAFDATGTKLYVGSTRQDLAGNVEFNYEASRTGEIGGNLVIPTWDSTPASPILNLTTGERIANFARFPGGNTAATIDNDGAWIAGKGFRVGGLLAYGPVRVNNRGEVIVKPSAEGLREVVNQAEQATSADPASATPGAGETPVTTDQPVNDQVAPVAAAEVSLPPVEESIVPGLSFASGRVADYEGTVYTYRILNDGTVALDEAGILKSGTSAFMVTKLKPGNKSVTITFNAPTTTKNLVVRASSGGKAAKCSPGKKRTCTITNLSPLQKYRFHIEGTVGKKKVSSPKSFAVKPFISMRRNSTTSLTGIVGKASGKTTYKVTGGCQLVSRNTRVKAPGNKTYCSVVASTVGAKSSAMKQVVIKVG